MKKIFCIDDDPVTLMFCSAILKKTIVGLEVETATNGEEALNYYQAISQSKSANNYPNIVLLDLNMPIMNGWEFLDEFIKKYYDIFPNTKIVILTSSINPKEEEIAIKYSIVKGFLSKPLTQEMILNFQEL